MGKVAGEAPKHVSGKELTVALDALCDLIACQHAEVQWLRRALAQCQDDNSTIVIVGAPGTGTKP